MAMTERRPPIAPGERAPDFVLSRVNQDGTVSLADYRGKLRVARHDARTLLRFLPAPYRPTRLDPPEARSARCRGAGNRRHASGTIATVLPIPTGERPSSGRS